MDQQVKWLSVTKIGVATTCPRRFRYRYVDCLPEPSSGVMLAGRVVHSVLEYAERRQLDSGKLPSASELDDLFAPTWENHVKEEEGKEGFVSWEWDEEDPEPVVKEQSRALVRLARQVVLPNLKPVMVEHNFSLDLPCDTETFRVYGVIDLVGEGSSIYDWKTVSGKVSTNARKLDYQFPAYSYFLRRLIKPGDGPIETTKIFLVRGSNPSVDYEKYAITQRLEQRFVEAATDVWRLVRGGGYPPNPNGWWCSPKWCSYYQICQEGN